MALLFRRSVSGRNVLYPIVKPLTHRISFQFTPLREGRRMSKSFQRTTSKYFNSRPCVRGDGEYAGHRRRPRRFQFTPLREGRRTSSWPPVSAIKFQFTPLREGRPEEYAEKAGVTVISIHAPA